MIDKQQLDAELTEVLKHLPGWQLDPTYANHCWSAALIDGTGRGIHINATHTKGRLYITGFWPRDNDHQLHRPDKCLHISIDRKRPPEKIAADIQRRFLPWYADAYAKEAGRVARHNENQTRQQKVAAELAAILGATVTQHNPCQVYTPGLAINVHSNGNVSIDLHDISTEAAKAVLKAFVKAAV